MDGFWLPAHLRRLLARPDLSWQTQTYAAGQPATPADPQAVTARYPQFAPADWQMLLAGLQAGRAHVPTGDAYWARLHTAMQQVARRLANPADPVRRALVTALPAYTGYSAAMLQATLASFDLMALASLPAAVRQLPTWLAAHDWQPLPGVPGRLRFFPATPPWDVRRLWPRPAPLFGPVELPRLVIGYGAGNVPGTALLITLLTQAVGLVNGTAPPALLIRNSRQEPLFGALILDALATADPDLLANVALLVWDFDDERLQTLLMTQADLVIAAASDETIAHIGQAARRASTRPRLHAHGHKVSFAAIGRAMLAPQARLPGPADAERLDAVTLLAALDSVFWDQNGCLSARVHFVEGDGGDGVIRYAQRLTAHCRALAHHLPRGAWPRQPLHDRFDRYRLLETTGQVQVFSAYDDPFVVALDARPLPADRARAATQWVGQVNECQGRVIIVRPVNDLMEIPNRYLALLPAANLQSLSVGMGPGEAGPRSAFWRFASACGERGVTAIRTVGRGAFPQLAYSWDGLLPRDLVCTRPPGRFTTVEFDDPLTEIAATWSLWRHLGAPPA